MIQPIFEGFFKSSEEARDALGPNLATEYFKRSEHLLRQKELRDTALDSSFPLPLSMRRHTTLPWLLALTGAQKILDFGGGLGWVEAAASGLTHESRDDAEYAVVEALAFIESIDRDIHAAAPPTLKLLSLEEVVRDETREFDIIYSNSVIQYSGLNPLSVLAKRFRPGWILLDDVIWSPKSSYWTIQNFFGEKQLHWVPSLTEILSTFERSGYELVLHMPYTSIIKGQPHTRPPMTAPPLKFQCPQALSVLFRSMETS